MHACDVLVLQVVNLYTMLMPALPGAHAHGHGMPPHGVAPGRGRADKGPQQQGEQDAAQSWVVRALGNMNITSALQVRVSPTYMHSLCRQGSNATIQDMRALPLWHMYAVLHHVRQCAPHIHTNTVCRTESVRSLHTV